MVHSTCLDVVGILISKYQGQRYLEKGKCPKLVNLDLTDCNRSTYVGESFAEVLSPCPHLTSLKLNGNLIGALGVEILTESVEKCKILTHLDHGFRSLQGMLVQVTNLTLLDLRTNVFDDVGNVMFRMSWSGEDSGLLLTNKRQEDV